MEEIRDMVHNLIGCAWGRAIATADDMDPCPEQAASITVLHDGPRELSVKLCPKHKSRVMEETKPSSIAVTYMTCAECGHPIACRVGSEPPASCEEHDHAHAWKPPSPNHSAYGYATLICACGATRSIG